VLLDIRQLSSVADYFVLCSAASERQVNAVVRDIMAGLRNDHQVRPLRVEGQASSGWVLLDYGDVVAHIFANAQREFYELEDLWSGAVPLVRVQ
jgi:ribosome-associated protein